MGGESLSIPGAVVGSHRRTPSPSRDSGHTDAADAHPAISTHIARARLTGGRAAGFTPRGIEMNRTAGVNPAARQEEPTGPRFEAEKQLLNLLLAYPLFVGQAQPAI